MSKTVKVPGTGEHHAHPMLSHLNRPSKHVHKMVAETAKTMCHEVYDALMQRNDWYALWKSQHPNLSSSVALEEAFVRKNWGKYVDGARATLAGMLSSPLDETLKESIMEALMLDNTLLRGRGPTAQ